MCVCVIFPVFVLLQFDPMRCELRQRVGNCRGCNDDDGKFSWSLGSGFFMFAEGPNGFVMVEKTCAKSHPVSNGSVI